jgi:tetratricopeptide (TPR) repeat protein
LIKVPKLNWILSLIACTSLNLGIITPSWGQALLPYSPELDTAETEAQGIALTQDVIQLLRLGRPELALPRAELATQLAPQRFETWLVLGTLYIQEGKDIDKGIRALENSQKLAPKEASILLTLGSAYFEKGDYQKAVENLQAGLELQPDSLEGLFNLGNSYLMLKQYPEAIATYEKSIVIEPQFWPSINNIGLIKYEEGDINEAIRLWQKTLEIDPQQSEPLLALAVANYTQGKQEEGLTLGKEALSLDSRYAELEFLKENLWGETLLKDTATFLETPTMQDLISRLQQAPPQPEE